MSDAVKVKSVWRNIKSAHVKTDTGWQPIENVFAKNDTGWATVYGPLPDNPPTPTSYESNVLGTDIALTFNTILSGGAANQFTIVVDGVTLAPETDYTFAVDGSQVILSLNTALEYLQTITVTYTKGTLATENGTYKVASFGPHSVVNNTPAPEYWISLFSNPSNNDIAESVMVDSNDDIIVAGSVRSTSGLNPGYPMFWKMNKDGNPLTLKSYTTNSSVAYDTKVILNSTDAVGMYRAYNSTTQKTNLNGTVQWARLLSAVGNLSVAQDSSGNIYVCGMAYTSAPKYGVGHIVKYDSSGNVVWKKTYEPTSVSFMNASFNSIHIDGSDNVVVAGSWSITPGSDRGNVVAKLDSDGNVIWSKGISSSTNYVGTAVTADSFGNVYAAYGDYPNGFVVTKLDSTNGNIIDKSKVTESLYCALNHFDFDDDDNLYGFGNCTESGSKYSQFFVKYDSSFDYVYSRKMSGFTGYFPSGGGTINNAGKIVLSGSAEHPSYSSNDVVLATLPADGSGTGTYTLGSQSFVYEAYGSETTPTVTVTDVSLTVATSSYTDSAITSYTTSTQSATQSIVEV